MATPFDKISVHRRCTITNGDVVYEDHGVDVTLESELINAKKLLVTREADYVYLALKIKIDDANTADVLLKYVFNTSSSHLEYSCSMDCWYRDGESLVQKHFEMDNAYKMGEGIPTLIFGNMASEKAIAVVDAINVPNKVTFLNLPVAIQECFEGNTATAAFEIVAWTFTIRRKGEKHTESKPVSKPESKQKGKKMTERKLKK